MKADYVHKDSRTLEEKSQVFTRWIDPTIEELKRENQELKKQLEEYDRKLFFTKNELDMRQKSIDNKLNQQKEFIDYLEKTIVDSKVGSGQQYYFKEILSRYKEIIGGKE